MKVQKINNGKVEEKTISPNDLAYYQFKGWTLVTEQTKETEKVESTAEPVTYRRRRRHNEE